MLNNIDSHFSLFLSIQCSTFHCHRYCIFLDIGGYFFSGYLNSKFLQITMSNAPCKIPSADSGLTVDVGPPLL